MGRGGRDGRDTGGDGVGQNAGRIDKGGAGAELSQIIFADGVKVSSYFFPGFSSGGFSIPAFNINIFFSYLVISILLNSLQSGINWLFRKEAD